MAEGRGGEVHVRFSVEFNSVYGQIILLSGSAPELGEFQPERALPLRYEHPGVWTADLKIKYPDYDATEELDEPLEYKYVLFEESSKTYKWEAGSPRVIKANFGSLEGDLLLKDVFRNKPDADKEIFSTAAFADVVFRREIGTRMAQKMLEAQESTAITKALVLGKGAYVARFSVFCARVMPDDEVCVSGSTEFLGQNDLAKAVPLADTHFPGWSMCVPMGADDHAVKYRFLIRKKGSTEESDVRAAEPEDYRSIEMNESDSSLINEARSRAVILFTGQEESFHFTTPWRGSGIAIPVFSLRTASSCGVGEFLDLKKMVDVCLAGGFQMLQLLPVNDTTVYNSWRDSYPYSANSCFALHPQYLNIDALGPLPSFIQSELEAAKSELNALKEIDYEKMMKAKTALISKMYALQKGEFLKLREFLDFFKSNQDWLVPYALFRMFTELNGSSKFDLWGARAHVTLAELEELASPDTFHFDYLGVAYYTQFHLHKQLKEAAEYAALRSVIFKGDLPIGVNRYCTDTWVNPHLFHLDMQAGAPADYFAEFGQNWGFPTYNWEVMSSDDYAWWRSRLGSMSKFFHAYRIDHILGFFRIWGMPQGYVSGACGRYKPAIPLKKMELDMKGLWDMDRFLSPYVHDGLLQQMFGNYWGQIKERFFEPSWGGRLKFKDEYKTERQTVDALTPATGSAAAGAVGSAISGLNLDSEDKQFLESLKESLLKLHSNVLLLQDVEDPDVYHPRYMMQKTSSFQELSDEWKRAFMELYDDYFFHRQDDLWREKAMEKLPMMKQSSNMLVCGEDLGFIPACVPEVMEATSIIGLRVQRMPETTDEFGDPAKYPWASVASLSSHDTSTLRGWYESLAPDARQRYYQTMLKMEGEAPETCTTAVVERALDHVLAAPSIWNVHPLQDLLGIDANLRREIASEEQVNNPANPNHYWRFRVHLDLDEILKQSEFLARVKKMNVKHGRGEPYPVATF
ncbi:4-alpha-glucanotransferase DPE2 [Porphyridium purpureum]|uniref:4-alpha-glucanotransferase n=1 Tax=Porphyridium purpureum TaxID=35688 RepID=A0A5J4Z1Q9_PORPP|nr:4-alpha-glucanotransferase DPE2 [Porphyridium purpureum]|eukprot:POR0525..scf295_1